MSEDIVERHTPGPWKVSICLDLILGGDGFVTASTKSNRRTAEATSANAAHIVHCVNLHDELVEALEGLIKELERNRPAGMSVNVFNETVVKARAAIAKARGEK